MKFLNIDAVISANNSNGWIRSRTFKELSSWQLFLKYCSSVSSPINFNFFDSVVTFSFYEINHNSIVLYLDKQKISHDASELYFRFSDDILMECKNHKFLIKTFSKRLIPEYWQKVKKIVISNINNQMRVEFK